MTVPMARVGDIAEQVRGVTYAKEEVRLAPSRSHVALLTAGNITESGISYDDVVYVPDARVSSKQALRKGDVLIAASSGSLKVVGKAGRIESEVNATFGAFCKVLRPTEAIDPVYFAHFFRTPEYRSRISHLAAGANINNLRNDDLNDLELPLPPLPEQRRIAAILDQADDLRTKRRRALELLDELADSVFVEMFGIGSPDFATGVLGDLVHFSSGKFLPAKRMVDTGDVPVFGGNGINGHHDEAMFEAPQIVVGRVGAYCGVVHGTPSRSWVTDNALIAKWDPNVLHFDYLRDALRESKLNSLASQSGQPLISSGRIAGVQIAVPPMAVQSQYSELIRSIQSVGQELLADLNLLDELFASLQHRAFRGEL